MSDSHKRDIEPALLEEYSKDNETKMDEMLESIEGATWDVVKDDPDTKVWSRYTTGECSDVIVTKTILHIMAPQEAMIDVMTMHKLFTPETMPQGPLPPEEMFAIYENMDSPHQDLIYFSQMKRPMPFVAPREFLSFRRKYMRGDKTIFFQRSVWNEDLKPQREGYVRGNFVGQLFAIEADPADPKKSFMTIVSHINPGGNLPTFAVNYSMKNQLEGVSMLRQIATDHYHKDIEPNEKAE